MHTVLSPFLRDLFVYLLLNLIAIVALLYKKPTKEQLGLVPLSYGSGLYAVAWGFVILLAMTLLQRVLISAFSVLPHNTVLFAFAHSQLQLFQQLVLQRIHLPKALSLLLLVLSLLAQTLFFQVGLYRTLRRSYSFLLAILCNTLIAIALSFFLYFSLIQAAIVGCFVLLVSWAYEKTSSLWVVSIAEGVYGLVAAVEIVAQPHSMQLFLLLLGQIIFEGLLFVLGVWLLRKRNLTLRQAGFAPPNPPELLFLAPWLGIMVFVIGSMFAAMQQSLLKLLFPHATWLLSDQGTAQHAFEQLHGWMRLGFVLIGVFLAPIAEETLFRGWLYTTLRNRYGMGWGLTLSSLIFAFAHLAPVAIFPVFLIGLTLALIYEHTHSLWMSMIVHGTNNAIAFLLLSFEWALHH